MPPKTSGKAAAKSGKAAKAIAKGDKKKRKNKRKESYSRPTVLGIFGIYRYTPLPTKLEVILSGI